MSGFCLPSVASHFIFFQDSSKPKKTTQNKLLYFLPRTLGSGLFFLMILFFPILAFPADLTLAWDPNTEPDLEGYGVYFKQDAPGPPYDLFGNVALPELSDPDNPSFTLTGLQKGSRYYITLTAYDTAGNESGYADPVCAQIGDQIVPCASAEDSGGAGSSGGGASSGGSSGGGSGGVAGCFIATSLNHPQSHATIVALLVLGAVFLVRSRQFSRK
jgi:uncharacterized membrane protein YgcG